MYEQIMPVDDKLLGLKYKPSKNKEGLYYKKMRRGQIFLDYRDVGGKSIEEQREEGPLCYSFPYDREIPREDAWGNNNDFMKEQIRLIKNGIKFRVSIISDIPLVGEIEFQNGFCKVCNKDFESAGLFCSEECRNIFNQEIEYEKGICTICNENFPEHILWSEECKEAFKGLKFESEFCKICHTPTSGVVCSNICETVFNINNSGREQGSFVRPFMKFLGMND